MIRFTTILAYSFFLVLFLGCPFSLLGQSPLGTSFLYQGNLEQNGNPSNGNFDFEFSLFDADQNGSQVGGTLLEDDRFVESGIFAVELDFGSGVFNGDELWLEISVREGSSTGPFTVLSPRQKVTAAPYALRATNATDAEALSGLTAGAFLRTDGSNQAQELTIDGPLEVGEIVFPDGSVQTSASTSNVPTVTTPEVYDSAFLTCGSNGESNPTQWSFITGRFAINVDGSSYEAEAAFSGVATMEDVAQRIQDGIRAATGRMETVQWTTDHLVISSGSQAADSEISVARSPAVGIDISGAGSDDWMDCDEGNGEVTEKVLNTSVYAGQLVTLGVDGRLDSNFVPESFGFVDNTDIFIYQMNPADWGNLSNITLAREGGMTSFSRDNSGAWFASGKFPAVVGASSPFVTWSDLNVEIEFLGRIGRTISGDMSFGLGGRVTLESSGPRSGFTWDWQTQKFYAVTSDGVAVTTTEIEEFDADDAKALNRFMIHFTPSKVKFYINSVLRVTHTTNIPDAGGPATIGCLAETSSFSNPTSATFSMVTVRQDLSP